MSTVTITTTVDTEVTEQKKGSTLSEKVMAISKLGVEAAKMDATTGINQDDSVFEKSLEMTDGLTMDSYAKHDEHRHDFAAGMRHAAGVIATDAMVENADLKIAEFSYNFGGNQTMDFTVHRSKEYNNLQDPENKIVKYGVVEANHGDTTVSNKGQFKKAQQLVNELAAEKLGKK